jgi:hypothetical protein
MSDEYERPYAMSDTHNVNGVGAKPKKGEATPLTHFHSLFYDTFSWEHPRFTGLLFAGSLALILLGHFIDILRYAFKGLYITFAVVALVEWAGRSVTGTGFMTQLRPKKYYTIPREHLEVLFAEAHDFLNFVVLEFQRVLFVENLPYTAASFFLSLISYFLIKLLPLWSLILIADICLFTLPLLYLQNQELIDAHLKRATDAVNKQVQQAKGIAAKHTGEYTNKAKAYASDLTGKVSAYQNRQKIPSSPKANDTATTTATDTSAH